MSTEYTYTKTTWVDQEDPGFVEGVSPALNKTNLNKIENGIEDCVGGLNDHEDRVDNLETKLASAEVEIYNGSATLNSWTYNSTYGWYECTVTNALVTTETDVYFTLANNRKAEYGNMTLLLPETSSANGSFKAAVVHTGTPASLTLYYKVTKVVALNA